MDSIDGAIVATFGVIPLILVGGLATKMATTMFPDQPPTPTRKQRGVRAIKRRNDSYLAKAHRALGI